MSIRTSLARLLDPPAPRLEGVTRKGVILSDGSTNISSLWQNYTFNAPSFQSMVREGYRANGAVFSCISVLAFAFHEPPLLVWEESEQGQYPLLDHELTHLLDEPNPLMSQDELLQHTITYMAIGGNCYWLKVRNAFKKVIELWPLHDGYLSPVVGQDSTISHYMITPDTNLPEADRIVPTSDIIHFRWMPDPLNPWKGLAPLIAIAREVDIDTEASRYLFNLLKNDAVPRLALIFPKEVVMDDDQYERVRTEWKEKHGDTNRGGVGIVEGGAALQQLTLNLKDLEFNILRRVPEARITAAFRVPAIVAGLNVGLENSTYSNFHEAILLMTERTLVPLWSSIAAKVNRNLFASEYKRAPRQVVAFDFNKVVAMAEKVAASRLWAADGMVKGAVTVNEYRSVMGLPRDAYGDVYLRPASAMEVPAVFLKPGETPPVRRLPEPADDTEDDNEPGGSNSANASDPEGDSPGSGTAADESPANA